MFLSGKSNGGQGCKQSEQCGQEQITTKWLVLVKGVTVLDVRLEQKNHWKTDFGERHLFPIIALYHNWSGAKSL